MSTKPIPEPDNEALLEGLKMMFRERSIMGALLAFSRTTGPIFEVDLPAFRTVFVSGPEAAQFVLVSGKDHFKWRNDTDPVAKLLGRGLLVTDDEEHDRLAEIMRGPLHMQHVNGYNDTFVKWTDYFINQWAQSKKPLNMMDEMRKVSLVNLLDTLFGIDFLPHLDELWEPILKSIDYISPGLWIVAPSIPRFGYKKPLEKLDQFFFDSIQARRKDEEQQNDLLGVLIDAGLDDQIIRDQLITMLIAGHDTNTALLTWCLYLVSMHQDVQQKMIDEVDAVCGGEPPMLEHIKQLTYIDQVIQETLRLYPPIHLGSRIAKEDIDFLGYHIPKDTRVMYSIYLTQRDQSHWDDADTFNPDNFSPENRRQHDKYTYLPFGGGKRNCIGMPFARLQAKVVMARILQKYHLPPAKKKVTTYMKATLETKPKVKILPQARS